MKNLIKKSLVIVLLFYTVISSAEVMNPTIVVNEIEGQSVVLTLKNLQEQTSVYIKDKNGVILYQEIYENPTVLKKYNFKLLPKGDYLFEIHSDTKIKMIPFTVTFDNVKLKKEGDKVVYKPQFKLIDNTIFIYKLAINYESLRISLYDSESHLIYKEFLDGSLVLERKLNVSKLEKGNYRLILKSEGLTLTENIKI